MSLARWNDNSVVIILSSAYGWKDIRSKEKRWDKEKQEKVKISCPPWILQYNQSMGGVDKLDYLLSLYRIPIKSKKWTLSHFLFYWYWSGYFVASMQCNTAAVIRIGIKILIFFIFLPIKIHNVEQLFYWSYINRIPDMSRLETDINIHMLIMCHIRHMPLFVF